MARNPVTRETSRMAQNERRKLERRIARIVSQEVGRPVKWAEVSNIYNSNARISGNATINDLLTLRSSLFSKPKSETNKQRVGYSVDVDKAAMTIEAFTQSYFGRETLAKRGDVRQSRMNRLFQRQMNLSTKKGGISTLYALDTKMFYAITKDIWQGGSITNKNTELIKRTGIIDLETLYRFIVDPEFDVESLAPNIAERLMKADEKFNLTQRREIALQNLYPERYSSDESDDDEDYDIRPDYDAPVDSSDPAINNALSMLATAMNYA